MDHLYWPEDHPFPRPKVPYLCAGREEILCNNIDGFETWPDLMRWDLDPTLDFLESATRLQGWLHFGLLRFLIEATDRVFELNDFLSEAEDAQYVRSSPIKDVIRISGMGIQGLTVRLDTGYFRSSNLHRANDEARYSGFWRALEGALRRSSPWVKGIIDHWEKHRWQVSCDPQYKGLENVFWSTFLLFEQISDRREDKIKPDLSFRRSEVDKVYEQIPLFAASMSAIGDRLSLLGRCPSVLKRTNLSCLETFRLCSVPVKFDVTHEDCHARTCKAFDIEENTYKMQHARNCDDRGCAMQRIDATLLQSFVDKDVVPLISSTCDDRGRVSIVVVDGTMIQAFTAISHVWAGGMGNFKENALYQCQLEQLHADLSPETSWCRRRSRKPIYYWLNTLCIPSQEGLLKTKAIGTMAYVYTKAASVLVVDPELAMLESRSLPKELWSPALLCSPWMARSWTLQEGALAVSLTLRFADRVVPFIAFDHFESLSKRTAVQALWSRDVDRIGTENIKEQQTEWARAAGIHFGFLDHPDRPQDKFINVWNELSKRGSMKSDDLAAILATLLDRGAREVLDLPTPSLRMHALLHAQRSLPLSLLFAPVDTECTTWCPAFPTCKQADSMLMEDCGTLQFAASGALQIVELNRATILQCASEVALIGQIRVIDSSTNRVYNISFPESIPRG
ncbi:hypothetical protein LTR05_008557, partial [Lithohypha guttulata]